MSKILLLNHHGLGDVLMSLPACRVLYDVLGNDLVLTAKSVNEAEVLRSEGFTNPIVYLSVSRDFQSMFRKIQELRSHKIRTVAAFYGYDVTQTKILGRLIGASRCITTPRPGREQFERGTLHKVYRHLETASRVVPSIQPTEKKEGLYLTSFDYSFSRKVCGEKPYVVFVPGSGVKEQFKRWPVAEYIELGRLLSSRIANLQILVAGSQSELDLGDAICSALGSGCSSNICGQPGFTELSGVFRRALLVIGSDNGGMHHAKATRARIVSICGPTNYSLTGPFEADLCIDIKYPGTPWYCKKELRSRKFSNGDPSMNIPAAKVLAEIDAKGLLP